MWAFILLARLRSAAMPSPWKPYALILQRIYGEELPAILLALPSLPPEQVDNLFIVDDDNIIKQAVDKAIAVPRAPSQQQKFKDLLKEAGIPGPLPKVIRTVIQKYARRLALIETPQQASDLYHDAKIHPSSSTRRHLRTQHGLVVNGLLFPEGAKPYLMTAVCARSGHQCVIKFLTQDGVASTEAQATHILCSDMPAEVPLVPGWVVNLTLSQERSELGRPPGTYAVLVMPRYPETLESVLCASDEVLAREMQRMVEALSWVHSKGYVHMDVKGANIFVDQQGRCFLGDLGSAVEWNSPITSTTQAFAPSDRLMGAPARYEYDWYMLLATLVSKARPEEELLDIRASYMEATKLKACAERLASAAPALQDLVSELVGRAGDLFHA